MTLVDFSVLGELEHERRRDVLPGREELEPNAWPWCCALVWSFGSEDLCRRSAHGFIELEHAQLGHFVLPVCWQHAQRLDDPASWLRRYPLTVVQR